MRTQGTMITEGGMRTESWAMRTEGIMRTEVTMRTEGGIRTEGWARGVAGSGSVCTTADRGPQDRWGGQVVSLGGTGRVDKL